MKALESDYIKFEIQKEADDADTDAAGIDNKHDKTHTSKNFKDMKISDFDVTTKEGEEGWKRYKEYLKSIK